MNTTMLVAALISCLLLMVYRLNFVYFELIEVMCFSSMLLMHLH